MPTLSVSPGESVQPIEVNGVHAVGGREEQLVATDATIEQILPRQKGAGDTSVLLSCNQGDVHQKLVLRLNPASAFDLEEGQIVRFNPTIAS